MQVLLRLVPHSWIGHRGLSTGGPAGPPGCSALSSWVLDDPAPPPATVRCGQDCALGALGPHMGRQPPALGGGGTAHPTRCGPEGLSREVCVLTCSGHGPHLPVLTHASSHVHTHSYAHLCMHVLCACAYACPCTFMHTRARVHVLTRAHTRAHTCSQHTQIVYGLVHMHLYTRVLSHTPLHTSPRTHLPVQPYMRTHTFPACTLISHIHTLTCTY